MKSNPSLWRVSIFAWLALAAAVLAILFKQFDNKAATILVSEERIENQLDELITELDQNLDELAKQLPDDHRMSVWKSSSTWRDRLGDEDYMYFVIRKDSLVFWSDNSILATAGDFEGISAPELVKFQNLYGLCMVKQKEAYLVAGVIPLQHLFPIENEYLSNRLLLPGIGRDQFEVVDSSQADLTIIDKDGEFLFGLKRVGSVQSTTVLWYLSVFFWCLAIVGLLLFMLDLLSIGFRLKNSPVWLLAFLADLILIKWLLKELALPGILYNSSWFLPFDNPHLFIESRGDVLMSLVFLGFFAIACNRFFSLYPKKVRENQAEANQRLLDSFSAVGWIVVFLAWTALLSLWTFVLDQRPETLEVHRVLSLDAASLSDLLILVISVGVFVLLSYKICKENSLVIHPRRFIIIPVVVGIVFFSVTRFMGFGPTYIEIAALFALIALSGVLLYRGSIRLPQVGIVLIIFVFSVFLVHFLHQNNKQRQNEIQTEIIQGLSNEHDPIAEMLLRRLEGEIYADSTLIELIRNPSIHEQVVDDYLKNNHLGLYWNRYRIIVNVCDSINMLYVLDNKGQPCLDYYQGIIENEGEALADGSNFYYRDNFDGIVYYLGLLPVYTPDSSYCYHLIFSAEAVLGPEGLGYPDVLIAGKDRQDQVWEEYSYAKYRDCQLISRSGEYSYSSTCEGYPSGSQEITYFEADQFDHWIYMVDDQSKIVLSKPKIRLLDHIISFSYMFVGLYLIWLIVSLFIYLPKRIGSMRGTELKVKIQLTLIGVLVVSFLLIGGGMYYFTVNQYERSNANSISEKAQSVLIEVQHKLEFEEELTAEWSADNYPSLQALLVKFSYVFNTDINLYSPQGLLLASSRPEVFNRNLTGFMMNPHAFDQMHVQDQVEYIHREQIGDLGYWSAYVPFYNGNNQLLAYLNLPYFSKQNEFRTEVSNFMVATLNGYFVLIFLAVVVAVVLGNQVTKPLRMLQEKFAQMELGGENVPIAYERRDEIGGLVKAYNKMVAELAESAEKLARSERETAWREMAKQIAHEIKNPLTPMKLSVQHLKRSWDDRVEDWEVYLDRVTKTLVDQIDALSAIANEFSQFAKMPKANRQKIDLILRIKNSLALFNEYREGLVTFEQENADPIFVHMDKEQLVQVFNNLVTNAIQSVPAGRTPEIRIWVERKVGKVRVAIQDNGNGITQAIQEKLFQPNFTTKTSGMGLGLAIAKNIIENSGGKIRFETELDKGSVFYLELPVVESQS